MATESRAWSSEERREVFLLGSLPLISAAVVVAVLFAAEPGFWPLAFIVSAVCAYVSLVVGVVPLLLLFKRLGWRSWHHFAAAGCGGVLIVWLVPVAVFGAFRSVATTQFMSGIAQAVVFLSVPAVVAACAATVFWFLCVRRRSSSSDA